VTIKIQAGTASAVKTAALRKNGLNPYEKKAGPSYGGKVGSSDAAGWLTRISIGFADTPVILGGGQTLVKQKERGGWWPMLRAMGETARSHRCLAPQLVPSRLRPTGTSNKRLAIVSENDDRSDQTLHPSQVA
jgi:hypothetical protein